MDSQAALPSGQYTSTIYAAIRDHRYLEAIEILEIELSNFPRSRAALSLLGYCFYHSGDFKGAVSVYEQLLGICPDVDEYNYFEAPGYSWVALVVCIMTLTIYNLFKVNRAGKDASKVLKNEENCANPKSMTWIDNKSSLPSSYVLCWWNWQAGLLFTNAVAILHPKRFLAKCTCWNDVELPISSFWRL